VYNTCAVKTPTENRMIDLLKKTPKTKKVIVTGCLPIINFDRLKREVRFDGILGPAPGLKIVEVIQRVVRNERVMLLNAGTKPGLDLPRCFENSIVSIVPVAYGCLGACSYCCVVSARGRLRSYSIDEIVDRVKNDVASGAKEVWLTSQDMACYGQDIGVTLIDLLEKICTIEGTFQVRIGMMTPNYALDILERLVEAYKRRRIFKFLHLPVQSGDNEVLKRMQRFCTKEDFNQIVRNFRKAIPNITIATDVICGFPGETSEAFEKTLHLMEKVKPDIVNISKFFPRPNTPAEKLKPKIQPREINERSRKMAELVKSISLEKNHAWIDWKGQILIDEEGKKPDSWIGRNFAYKPIVVESNESLLGRTVNVHVVKAFQTYLKAEILN
ncbi:tRNA (N(6)-L-threonylcarbamoyladenosine(37)-C(2))-methylthiotransferase, partial [Candidatus Bathyarchaeota archaeon]|nr:tRNA (N(6)-L-threonylcarbamoyladenosine(37)-C(2))-methylthiotransferase [Candidatus Bathyarchaeota archaeon]